MVAAATMLALFLLAAVAASKIIEQRRVDHDREHFRVHFAGVVTADELVRFVRTLTTLPVRRGMRPAMSVVFEAVARHGTTEHWLALPRTVSLDVRRHLEVAVPTVHLEAAEHEATPAVVGAELGLRSRERALRIDQPEAVAAAMLTALAAVRDGETAQLQVVVWPERPPRLAAPQRSRPATTNPLLAMMTSKVPLPTAKELREMQAEPALGVVVRIGASGSPERTKVLVAQVRAALRLMERPGVHFTRRSVFACTISNRIQLASTPVFERPMLLNAREVALVVGWPIGDGPVPGMRRTGGRLLPPATAVLERGRVLGMSALPGSTRPLALSAKDSLQHTHVIGPTGVGKSTLLASLAAQDLAAGLGLVVIDPKGDLVATILDQIPANREGDVIVLDPTDDRRPIGLNLLADAGHAGERVADEVVGLFHRLFAASWGPRTADVLHASLLTLAATSGMTLCELPTLLTDDAFRARLMGQLSDRVLLGFWSWYEALSPGERAQAIGPVMNKLRAFLLRRRVRTILGQAEPSWSLGDVLDRRKVLLVNLARGELGSEAAALVGSLVVAQLWRSTQRRAIRTPVMVTIDEFQDVVNVDTDLGEVLAQARSMGVGLTVAHQHLGQLDAKLRAAVFANARSKVVFQTSADDAGILSKQLGTGLTPADLMTQPAYTAYFAPCSGGQVLPTASLATQPLAPGTGRGEAIRAASRERYGQDREAVEAAMAARQATDAGGSVGRRRRAVTPGTEGRT